MEVSRLIFNNKTKEFTESNLKPKEKGRLRWQKLKECNENGSLMSARNRYEVANLAYFTDRKKGYSWVANMIRRNHIKEVIYGINDRGIMEYEYHLGVEPDYDYNGVRNKKSSKDINPQITQANKTTLREKGKIYYSKLKECEEKGLLQNCKTKADVVKVSNSTSHWIRDMIKRGYLNEQLLKYENGCPVYKFNLTGKIPNYDYINKKISNEPKIVSSSLEHKLINEIYKLEFTNNNIKIKLDLDNWDKVNEIIKNILGVNYD